MLCFLGILFPSGRQTNTFKLLPILKYYKVQSRGGKQTLPQGKKAKIGVFSSLVSLIFTMTFKILIYLLTPCHTHSAAFPVFEYSLAAPIVFKGFFSPTHALGHSEFPFLCLPVLCLTTLSQAYPTSIYSLLHNPSEREQFACHSVRHFLINFLALSSSYVPIRIHFPLLHC